MSDELARLRAKFAAARAAQEDAERRALALDALQENFLARLDAHSHAIRMYHSTHRHAHSLEEELARLQGESSDELLRLRVSPKAQLRALSRSVPKSLGKRLGRGAEDET